MSQTLRAKILKVIEEAGIVVGTEAKTVSHDELQALKDSHDTLKKDFEAFKAQYEQH